MKIIWLALLAAACLMGCSTGKAGEEETMINDETTVQAEILTGQIDETGPLDLDEVFSKESGQSDRGEEPVLLTEAPPLILQDALSSTYEEFQVQSGNYTWNYKNHKGEMVGVTACGSGPLDAALKIPDYNKLDAVPYMLSMTSMPDKITLLEYDFKDAGREEAEPLSETTYEDAFLVSLKPERIYNITAQWAEEKLEENGFYGTAEYVISTK